LRDVLKKTGTAAVGRFVMHTKQHLAMLIAREDYLIMEELRFSHEVKEIHEAGYLDEVNLQKKYSPREMAMATNLVKGMTASWDPDKYKDTYYDDLMRIIRKKAKEGDEYRVPKEPRKEEPPSNVVDLLPLLKKSLETRRLTHRKDHHP
jgi:DNA end-binding protein Ku